jgi:hypothetical protein
MSKTNMQMGLDFTLVAEVEELVAGVDGGSDP